VSALDTLEQQLGDAVERYAAADRGFRPSRRSRKARWSLVAAALALVGAVAAVPLFPSSSSRADALPALAHARTDVTGVPRLRRAVGGEMDLHRAYAFAFGGRTGYVLTSADGAQVCVALPDPPAGYGATCASTAAVVRRGLLAMLVAPTPDSPPSRIALLLPDGVPAPTIEYRDGTRRTLPVRNGVATATIRGDGTLRWTAKDGERSSAVQRSEPEGDLYVDCGDGRVVKAESKVGPPARWCRG